MTSTQTTGTPCCWCSKQTASSQLYSWCYRTQGGYNRALVGRRAVGRPPAFGVATARKARACRTASGGKFGWHRMNNGQMMWIVKVEQETSNGGRRRRVRLRFRKAVDSEVRHVYSKANAMVRCVTIWTMSYQIECNREPGGGRVISSASYYSY
jgi:hypothetical protein